MEVRPGYKLTEVGVIPEDWNVCRFSDHFLIYAGGDAPNHSLSNNQSSLHPYPIFANSLSKRGLYGYTAERRSNGDSITITARGYLGHAEYRSSPFFPIVRLLVLEPIGKLDARFTAYSINEFVEFAVESTGVPQLTAPHVGKYSIAAPPTLEEQRVIAAALNDVDILLDGLDRLIAKKRDIKQAAMQQLLTGKMRLPGFHDAWIILTAGEIGKFHGGCGFPIQWQGKHNGTYPFFKVSDMNNDGNEDYMTAANNYISESVQRRLGANIFPQGSIVLAKVGAAIFLERKKILGQPSCIDNNMTAYVMDTQRVDVRFIHALLLLTRLGDLVSTTALPSINGKQLSGISISLPSLHEQKAIVAILSEMDTELAVLEHRRDKTKLLKQAMMQELLTGRIRLV